MIKFNSSGTAQGRKNFTDNNGSATSMLQQRVVISMLVGSSNGSGIFNTNGVFNGLETP